MSCVSSGSYDDTFDHGRDETTGRMLREIAATLGVNVSVFFQPSVSVRSTKPRSRREQDAALLKAFGRVSDPQMRERLVALIEAEAEGVLEPTPQSSAD